MWLFDLRSEWGFDWQGSYIKRPLLAILSITDKFQKSGNTKMWIILKSKYVNWNPTNNLNSTEKILIYVISRWHFYSLIITNEKVSFPYRRTGMRFPKFGTKWVQNFRSKISLFTLTHIPQAHVCAWWCIEFYLVNRCDNEENDTQKRHRWAWTFVFRGYLTLK